MSGNISTKESVLKSIKGYILKNGRSPTYREISSDVGRAVSVVRHHATVLANEGLIEITPGISRGIKLVPQDGD